ncbi:RidA family protein [Natronorubrum sp. FCH18a]|uniref:RidA family protein n=1 Tax=Natronorubrum sp. FCH18a TaxID=3447018 RepID=UPI003F5129A4
MTFETFHTGTNWETDADFSQVARIPADADIVVTSGQIAYDEDGNVVGRNDIHAQVEQCFENLGRTLESAGSSYDNVVKLRYSITDPEYYETIKDVRTEYLTEPYPTGMLAVVDELAEPELMVEIEAIAVGT